MKKLFSSLVLLSLISTNICFASTSVSSLKRELSGIEYTIKQNQRKISSIQSSRNLSENEKKSKIRRLENENYYLKRKLNRVKSDLRRY